MVEVKCKDHEFYYGRDKNEVQKQVDLTLCSRAKDCDDGEKKVSCGKRTFFGPSDQAPTVYMAVVYCPCPSDIPKKPERTRSVRRSLPRIARTSKGTARRGEK